MRRSICSMMVYAVLLVQPGVTSAQFESGRWIDLTHSFNSATIYWPNADEFELERVFGGQTAKGYYYTANNFRGAEHGGTHIDAPIHFFAERWHVDEIPLERLIGPAVVVDVSGKVSGDRDYRIQIEDFADWEANHGRIPDGAIVLLNTGSSSLWPDRDRYMGTSKRGDEGIAALSFPGLDPEAAQWLVENRRIDAIGLDTPSIDFGRSQYFESHRILFEHNVPAFENVADLDRLPPTGATIVALPMKIEGGSGAPIRIVAFIPDGK